MMNQALEQTTFGVLGIHLGIEGETCIVSHPEAGGPCGRTATLTVYGLPFCEAHGEECAWKALVWYEVQEENIDHWEENFESGCRPLFTDYDEDLDTAVGEILKRPVVAVKEMPALDAEAASLLEGLGSDEKHYWRDILPRAYPLRQGLVAHPRHTDADMYMSLTLNMHTLMLYAYKRGDVEAVWQLEPLREKVTAQHSYAEQM